MPMRRESGRRFGAGPKGRGPRRGTTRTEEARSGRQRQDLRDAAAQPRPQERVIQQGIERRQQARARAEREQQEEERRREQGRSLLQKILRSAGEGVETLPGVGSVLKLAQADVPKPVERELRGEGEIAKALSKLGKSEVVQHAGAGLAGKVGTKGTKGLAKRFTEDIANLPSTALPAVYVPARAAARAIEGDTSELEDYVEDVTETDPLVSLATGHPGRALEQVKEHPGFAAVEVLGAKGAAGRAAGRAARGAGVGLKKAGAKRAGEAVRRVGATETRPDATTSETTLREVRTYSPDVLTKGGQVLSDKARSGKARRLRRRAETAEPEQAAALRARAARVDPEVISDRALQRRVDMTEGVLTARRRRTLDEPDVLDAQPADLSGARAEYAARLKDLAVKGKASGDILTWNRERARRFAENLTAESGVKHRAVVAELPGIDTGAPVPVGRQLLQATLDAVEGKGPADAQFAVIPETAAQRIEQHLRVSDPSDTAQLAQAFRGAFSRTVLSTSPSRLIGDLTESPLRLAVARAGPRSYVQASRVLKRMREIDPDAAAQLEDLAKPGGQAVLATRARYLDPDELEPGVARSFAKGVERIRTAPVGKQATIAWRAWVHFINAYLAGKIARGTQHAMLGKAMRDSGLLSERMLKLSSESVDQAARGLTDTAEQIALAHEVRRSYGIYDGLTPGERKIIANYTPFLAWVRNSAEFLGRLPFDHPTLSALLTINDRATEEWRQAMGLDVSLGEDEDKGGLPRYKRGSIPAGDSRIHVARNTPFGLAMDPTGTLGSMVLPHLSGAIQALEGRDWRGYPLQDDSDAGRVREAIESVLSSSVPAYAIPERTQRYAEDPGRLLNAVRVKESERQPKRKKLKRRKPAGGFATNSGFDTDSGLFVPEDPLDLGPHAGGFSGP